MAEANIDLEIVIIFDLTVPAGKDHTRFLSAAVIRT